MEKRRKREGERTRERASGIMEKWRKREGERRRERASGWRVRDDSGWAG
jgi:hypothetical protein